MKRASRSVKLYVGGFVVGMAVIVALALLVTGNDLSMIKSKTRFVASFKDTSGLQVGAPVKMGGVDVGTVEAITIKPGGGQTEILISLMVYGPFDKLIKTDSEVGLETQGVLGDKYVMLTAGTSGAEPIKKGDLIKAKEKLEMSAVMAKSADIVSNVNASSTKLAALAEALPDQAAMKKIVSELSESVKNFHAILVSLQADKSVISALSNEQSGKNLTQILDKLAVASVHFESIAKKIDDGHGTLGALVNDSSLYDDMRALMGRANRSKAAKSMLRKALEETTGKPSQDDEEHK